MTNGLLRSYFPNSILSRRLGGGSLPPAITASLESLGELTYSLPPGPLAWLEKYGITEHERLVFGYQWSEDKNLLIFPITSNGRVIGFNGRYFGDNPKHPKYITKILDKNYVLTFKPDVPAYPTLVLTEDVVSALKVGRQSHTMALLGTHIPAPLLARIVAYCLAHRLCAIVWLDGDKKPEALKWAKRLSQFIPATCIWTEKDPKEYTNEEILEFLSSHIQVPAGEQGTLEEVQSHP